MHHYIYDHNDGSEVTAYVVDTGVNIEHTEFEGRAVWGQTIPEGDEDVDGNGHGSHVAGTIAGKTYGVAKKAKVVAVKVLRSNGSGSMSDVVKGIEWVTLNHKDRVKNAKKGKKERSVANMSLGGGRSRILDAAVDAAVASGVHFAVAAGNDNRDAWYISFIV
jgi:cerevisin